MLHFGGAGVLESSPNRSLMGGAEARFGRFYYVGERASLDVGLHLQVLYGRVDTDNDGRDDAMMLRHYRLLVRLGVSLWNESAATVPRPATLPAIAAEAAAP